MIFAQLFVRMFSDDQCSMPGVFDMRTQRTKQCDDKYNLQYRLGILFVLRKETLRHD